MERIKRVMTEETKKKIANSNKGKKASEQTKSKLREARAKRIITDETKERIREGLIQYWKNVIWVDENINNEIKADN